MKIAIIGYGKMGRTIEKLAQERGHEIALIITPENHHLISPKDFDKAQIDVAIEFTNPDSAFENITACFKAGVNVVSGSTGWLDQFDAALEVMHTENKGFVYASNFSVGVNIFFEVNKRLAQLMNGQDQYKVGMKEIHHTQKLDAPSGTAVTLANGIIENMDSKSKWTLEEEALHQNQIPIRAERIDPTPGTHIVYYTSEIDDIEIKHTAHNRMGFALGAIVAAEYIQGKKGLHKMKDVLGI